MAKQPIKKGKLRDSRKPISIVIDTNVVKLVVEYDMLSELCSTDLIKIKKAFGVEIDLKGNTFYISGDVQHCRKAAIVLEKIFDWIDCELVICDEDIDDVISEYLPKPYSDTKFKAIYTTYDGKEISPRTKNQEAIVKNIKYKKLTFVAGCAGGGKTLFALVMGLKYLAEGRYDNIRICRPLVHVGGKDALGFMPGDLDEKIANYYETITHELMNLVGIKEFEQMVAEKKLIFTPVSFLRGATLDNSYVIIDEIQNLSSMELRTILSRFGTHSKYVCCGDSSQTDLKSKDENSLDVCVKKLGELEDVGVVKITKDDIQRSRIVMDIVEAFEE